MSDPTSSKAAKQILHLQEQNRLLMAENRVLRDSLAVLAPEAGLEAAASGLASYMNSPASRGNPNNNNNNNNTDKSLSIEDQMSSILGKMIELIRHDISAQEEEKRRHDNADGGGDDDPNNNVMSDRESFLDSLRHVFVDSIHMLSEVMINTEGYWGTAFNDKNDRHPMSWLINKFPVVQSSSSSSGSGGALSLDWYVFRSIFFLPFLVCGVTACLHSLISHDTSLTIIPPSIIHQWTQYSHYLLPHRYPLHWCVLSNSSDLIDVEVLYSHYCSTPESRLKVRILVYCCSAFFLVVCDVFVSLSPLSIYCCLPAFSDTT
jgi:hypothetical protein